MILVYRLPTVEEHRIVHVHFILVASVVLFFPEDFPLPSGGFVPRIAGHALELEDPLSAFIRFQYLQREVDPDYLFGLA